MDHTHIIALVDWSQMIFLVIPSGYKHIVVNIADVFTRYPWNVECTEQPMRSKTTNEQSRLNKEGGSRKTGIVI